MQGFQLRHQDKGLSNADRLDLGKGLIFETCLRRMQILKPSEPVTEKTLSGKEAYLFLLEVICGLKSPLFGETEILGQFKQFLSKTQASPEMTFFKPWSQALLEDCKKIRTRFLQGHASQSYGSLLRKKIPAGQKVLMLGSGQFAESLVPWLSQNEVEFVSRNPEKTQLQFQNYKVHKFSDILPSQAWLVLVAPLTNSEVQDFLTAHPMPWIDLREKTDTSKLPAPLFHLKELFAEIQNDQEKLSTLRAEILQELGQLCTSRFEKPVIRPLGWDDLCA